MHRPPIQEGDDDEEKGTGLIWRNGAYAGEFGDSHIAETDLEGGHTAPAFKTLMSVIRETLPKRRKQLTLFSDSDIAKIENVLFKDFDAAIAVMDDVHKVHDNKGFVVFLKGFLSRVSEMKEGERLSFSGGWMRKSGGHAIMHTVHREKDGAFGFVVSNTGNGVQYHPAFSKDYPKTKQLTTIYFPGIPKERFLEEEFWFSFWKMQVRLCFCFVWLI